MGKSLMGLLNRRKKEDFQKAGNYRKYTERHRHCKKIY